MKNKILGHVYLVGFAVHFLISMVSATQKLDLINPQVIILGESAQNISVQVASSYMEHTLNSQGEPIQDSKEVNRIVLAVTIGEPGNQFQHTFSPLKGSLRLFKLDSLTLEQKIEILTKTYAQLRPDSPEFLTEIGYGISIMGSNLGQNLDERAIAYDLSVLESSEQTPLERLEASLGVLTLLLHRGKVPNAIHVYDDLHQYAWKEYQTTGDELFKEFALRVLNQQWRMVHHHSNINWEGAGIGDKNKYIEDKLVELDTKAGYRFFSPERMVRLAYTLGGRENIQEAQKMLEEELQKGSFPEFYKFLREKKYHDFITKLSQDFEAKPGETFWLSKPVALMIFNALFKTTLGMENAGTELDDLRQLVWISYQLKTNLGFANAGREDYEEQFKSMFANFISFNISFLKKELSDDDILTYVSDQDTAIKLKSILQQDTLQMVADLLVAPRNEFAMEIYKRSFEMLGNKDSQYAIGDFQVNPTFDIINLGILNNKPSRDILRAKFLPDFLREQPSVSVSI